MLPIALGLSAALCVGIGDVAAGLASRRLTPILVGFWAQGFGAIISGLFLILLRPQLAPGQLPWGLAAGVATGIGLALMYQAMAVGAISLVGPITACAVIFPVIFAVASGEAVTPIVAAGIVAIIGGVVLVSMQPELLTGGPTGADGRLAVLLALAATVGFGAFFIMIDLAPQASGWGTLWTAGAIRLGSFFVQSVRVLLGPRRISSPGRYAPAVAVVGLTDQMAVIFLGLGAMTDAYGVVTALMGLYPVVVVFLGTAFLGERLTRLQATGATLAIAGATLVSV